MADKARIIGKNRIPTGSPKKFGRFVDALAKELPEGCIVAIPRDQVSTRTLQVRVIKNKRPTEWPGVADAFEAVATATKCRVVRAWMIG